MNEDFSVQCGRCGGMIPHGNTIYTVGTGSTMYCKNCAKRIYQKDTNPEVSIPKVKKEDEYHIDEIVHNLEALDFNSREARENVNQVLQTLRNTIKTQILKILTEEINIAHSEGEKTSRLTSAFNKINKL